MVTWQIPEVIIQIYLMQATKIFIFLTDVAAVAMRAAHLNDGLSRVPAITVLPKAVFAVKSAKTISLISCGIYPTHP